MKQPPFTSRFRVTSVCRLILLLAAIKVGFLASLVLNSAMPFWQDGQETSVPTVAERKQARAGIKPDARPVPENASLVASAASEAPLAAEAAVPCESRGENNGEHAAGPAAPVEDALALASSHTALGSSRLLGASVAYAADLAPVPPAMPAPNVRVAQPGAQPYVPDVQVTRPDEAVIPTPPAPNVKPYVSRDSAAQKQAELTRQEQELLALQQQMEHRMTELHGLEGRLQTMIQQATTTQDGKFKQLVDMYANMKPRQAAAALTSVDEEVAVRILTGMKSKQSGDILSYMEPRHAAKLSEVMAKMQM